MKNVHVRNVVKIRYMKYMKEKVLINMSTCGTSKTNIKRFLLCLFLTLVGAVVCNGNEIYKNKEALYYGINEVASSDPFASNGGDFFVIGDKLYVLLWTSIDGQPQGGAKNSILAFTSLNSMTWTTMPIPGKAYYLGLQRNEICSIQPLKGSDDSWVISFYNIN